MLGAQRRVCLWSSLSFGTAAAGEEEAHLDRTPPAVSLTIGYTIMKGKDGLSFGHTFKVAKVRGQVRK